MDKWISNDPEVTDKLKKADDDYQEILQKAESLPLMQKVIAINKARAIRDARYKIALGEKSV